MINNLLDSGKNQSEVAQMLGISRQAVNQILDRHKKNARAKLQYALRIGEVIKPKLCRKCGLKKLLSAHHRDYGLPLDVLWLCDPCHAKEDKKVWNDPKRNGYTQQTGYKISQSKLKNS